MSTGKLTVRNNFQNVLQGKDLSAKTSGMDTAARVRRRLNEILAEHRGDKNWTQNAVSERIEGRNQSWVSKVCKGKDNGGIDVRLEDLDVLAEALQTTAVELVRDSERYELVADLRPHEMQLLRQFRRLGDAARDAVLTVVAHMKPTGNASKGSQHVDPERPPVTPHVRELAQSLHRAIEEEHEKQETAPPDAGTDDRVHPAAPPRPRPGYRSRHR